MLRRRAAAISSSGRPQAAAIPHMPLLFQGLVQINGKYRGSFWKFHIDPWSFQPQSPPCKIDPTAHGEEAARSLKFSPFPVAAARRSCVASRSSRSLSSLPEAAKTNGLAPATWDRWFPRSSDPVSPPAKERIQVLLLLFSPQIAVHGFAVRWGKYFFWSFQ
jgi:hypothetical protein